MLRQLNVLKVHQKSVSSSRYFSVTATNTETSPINDFRTAETSPGQHTHEQLAKFYTIQPDLKKQIYQYGGLPKSFEKQVKTFGEAALMVRPPALEIMHYIKNTDLATRPVNRYLLYGPDGVGKSLTLAHLLHFGAENDFLLIHVPWVPDWFKKPKEIANAYSREGHVDLPLDAAAWLIHFKNQNAKLLPKLNLTTSKEIVWSKRESTPAGATLSELIEHGIARVKYASEVMSVLVAELKAHSTAGRCKVMVGIDGFNAFFHPKTLIKSDMKQKMTPDKITISEPFLNITKYDWTNGVCVLVADRIAMTEGHTDSEMPRYLLGKEGFEHLDPFVPVRVDGYSDKEFQTCIDYYVNRRWIQNQTEGFDKELKFLSGKNPFRLMRVCAPL